LVINNFLAFVLHIVLIIITILFGSINIYYRYFDFIHLVVMMVGYWSLGYFVLRHQESKMKNMLSVSSVSVIGLLVWIFDYILLKQEGGAFISLDFTGIFFELYNMTFISIHELIKPFEDTNQIGVMRGIYYIWLCPLPSTFIWVGLQMKEKGNVFSKGKYKEKL